MKEKSLKQLAEEFQFYMLWGEFRECEECKLSVEKESDVLLAVKKAYIDMTPRTINGLGMTFLKDVKDGQLKKFCVEYKEACVQQVQIILAQKIALIFRGECSYNHSELCKCFNENFYMILEGISSVGQRICEKEGIAKDIIIDCDRVLVEKNNDEKEMKYLYGKAQKIVNMTFKYLTLFDDAGNHEDIFEKCDMPIDSIIISYFNKVDKKENHKGEKKIIQTNTTWSYLTENEYDNMRNAMKIYCDENMTGRLLYDEFAIWGEEQKKNKQTNRDAESIKAKLENKLK